MDEQKPPPRRFKTRSGIQRKTAEERAASIRAESLRKNQHLPQPTPATAPKTEKRATFAPTEPRLRDQNTQSVFGSASTLQKAKTKPSNALTGTSTLIERGEVEDDDLSDAVSGRLRRPVPKAKGKRAAQKDAKKVAKEDEVTYSSEDEEGANAVDIDKIEFINISSDDEAHTHGDDEALSQSRKAGRFYDPGMGLRPVRAARDPTAVDESGAVRPSGLRRGDRRKADLFERNEKVDVTNEGDLTATAIPHDEVAPKPPSPTKKRRKSSTRDTKPSFETLEERREKEILLSDLQTMKNELCPSWPPSLPKSKGKTRLPPTSEAPKLYLFQFPPLTPMLVNPSLKQAPSSEPPSTQPPDPIDVDAPASQPTKTKPSNSPPNPTVLTTLNSSSLPTGIAGRLNIHQSGKVTIEWGSQDSENPDPETALMDAHLGDAERALDSEAGDTDSGVDEPLEDEEQGAGVREVKGGLRVGQGITNFDVNLGMEVDFLQDVVVLEGADVRVKGEDKEEGERDVQVDDPSGEGQGSRVKRDENGDGDEGARLGEACALGQVRMKFVVVPDWERIFE